MKFIGFWELCPDDLDKVIEKTLYVMKERQSGSKKYGTAIYGPYAMGGEYKGFTVFEFENDEQMVNITLHYGPELRWKFVNIVENTKVIEHWQKMKK